MDLNLDPYHCLAGDAVMQHINWADYQDAKYQNYRPEDEYMFTGGMLVNPMSEFACEGILKGFEFFVKAATATPALKFKVGPFLLLYGTLLKGLFI